MLKENVTGFFEPIFEIDADRAVEAQAVVSAVERVVRLKACDVDRQRVHLVGADIRGIADDQIEFPERSGRRLERVKRERFRPGGEVIFL